MSSSKYKKKHTHLSMISEGDELIKFQDVLNSRGSLLTQEELWAVCRECCVTLKRISDSTESIQSLCVMLETLAFDSHGNVCFIDHEDVDSENDYRPPEYDAIGNSTKGFIYSLGLVMHEASAYTNTASKIPQQSPRMTKLLRSMIEADHSARISIEGVLAEADLYFKSVGGLCSLEICRKLVQSVQDETLEEVDEEEVKDSVEADNTQNISSTSSSFTLNTSVDMSLQDLVDKYKPSSSKARVDYFTNRISAPTHKPDIPPKPAHLISSHASTVTSMDDAVIVTSNSKLVEISPPEPFTSKMERETGDEESSSAFISKQGVSSTVIKTRDFGEGATLKAGNTPLKLPDAYRSSATHFTPIVLASHEKKSSPQRINNSPGRTASKTDKTIKELKRQLLKSHNQQEGEAKLSPRDTHTQSLPCTLARNNPSNSSAQSSQELYNENSSKSLSIGSNTATTNSSITATSNKPIPAAKPSIVPRERGGATTPVMQAVKPQPRNIKPGNNQEQTTPYQSLDNLSMNVNNSNSNNVMNTQITSIQSTVQTPPNQNTLPTVSTPQTNTPMVANGAAISSTIISGYAGVPMMLQQNPSTGAVSWIPVVAANAAAYNIAPYWAMSPPGAAVIPAAHVQQQQMPSVVTSSTNLSHTFSVMDTPPIQSQPSAAQLVTATSNNVRTTSTTTQSSSVLDPAPTTAQATSQKTEGDSSIITKPSVPQRKNLPSERKKNKASKSLPKDDSAPEKMSKKAAPQPLSNEKKPKDSEVVNKIRHLLKNEFSFDGYMEQGEEDYEMAMFIKELPVLEFSVFINVIVAKYGDMYWSDELLDKLYTEKYNKRPETDRPPSGTLRTKSARILSVDEPNLSKKQDTTVVSAVSSITTATKNTSQRYATSPFRPIPMSEAQLTVTQMDSGITNDNNNHLSSLVKPKPVMAQIHQTESGAVDVAFTQGPMPLGLSRIKSASVQDLSRSSVQAIGSLVKSKSQTNITKLLTSGPVKTASMTPLVKSLTLPNGATRKVMYIEGKDANPLEDDLWLNRANVSVAGSAFDQESDSHSQSSASELRAKSKLQSSSYILSGGLDDQLNEMVLGSKLSSEYESDSSLASHLKTTSSAARVSGTFVYASYMADNKDAISLLGEKSENKSAEGLKKKIADLNQQINVNCKRRNKAIKYINKIIDSQAHGQTKGSMDYKSMLQQIKAEYEESVKEIEYLVHAKTQLEVLIAEQFSLDVSFIFSLTKLANPLIVVEFKENPTLQFQTQKEPKTGKEIEVLYAGQQGGLVSYLYARGALSAGYVLEFFHAFRYFITPVRLLAFFISKYNSAIEMQACEIREKVLQRTTDLLLFWVNCYYTVDFYVTGPLSSTLINFLQDEMMNHHPNEAETLLRLVDEYENDKGKNSEFVDPLPSENDLDIEEDSSPIAKKLSFIVLVTNESPVRYIDHQLDYLDSQITKAIKLNCLAQLKRTGSILKRTELDDWLEDSKWNSRQILTIGSGKNGVQYKRTRLGIRSCAAPAGSPAGKSKNYEGYGSSHLTGSISYSFSVMDFTPGELAEQLTLMEQALFKDVHPVHFMNTLAQGIGVALADGTAEDMPLNEKRLMFCGGYMQVLALYPMIQHSKKISHWVTAEIINATHSTKTQTSIVSKLIQVAKICKDLRNFATCLAIKDGLDHILIRHIPAWKEVPHKLTQELSDLKLQHKTDADAIKLEQGAPGVPTIPCVLLYALHVQQHEQGGFTLANGMFRWLKLRKLAHLVDVIRVCKRYKYQFTENADMKELLSNRIAELNSISLDKLAVSASSNNSISSGSAAHRWTNVFKKVKGKLSQ